MKTFILLILSFFSLISCSSKEKAISKENTVNLFVYKIEKKIKIFIIYAERDDKKYKIISKRVLDENCSGKEIEINYNYDFELTSILYNVDSVSNKRLNPVNIIDKYCITVDESTIVCTDRESGFFDLYKSNNLCGLIISKGR